MTAVEVLKPICEQERENMIAPFGMDYEGKRWAAATNGFMFAALVGDCETRPNAPKVVENLLSVALPPTHRVSVALLKEWAGEIPPPPSTEKRIVQCEECHGSGEVYCDECDRPGAECHECEGTGKAEERPRRPEPRLGRLLHGVLNRILLAQILATVPDGVTEILIGQAAEADPYIFRADNWIGAVMPMKGAREGLPRFEMVAA